MMMTELVLFSPVICPKVTLKRCQIFVSFSRDCGICGCSDGAEVPLDNIREINRCVCFLTASR